MNKRRRFKAKLMANLALVPMHAWWAMALQLAFFAGFTYAEILVTYYE